MQKPGAGLGSMGIDNAGYRRRLEWMVLPRGRLRRRRCILLFIFLIV